jgi:flagellar hook-associated protein 3 FlgL
MRITSSMMMNGYLYNLNGNLNRLSKYLEQESTGKAINRISDDPVKTTQSLSARNKLSGISRYQENVGTADGWLTEVEEAVSELNDIIGAAYEKTIAASTGILGDDDLTDIAQEIAALRDEVLSTANASYGGSYLFAGYNTTGTSSGKLPYTVDSNGDLYYNGINMSNEASVDNIAGAAAASADALNTLTAENTTAQATAVSDYKTVIQAVSAAVDSADEIAASTKTALIAAEDISSSADIDAATAADLTTAAASLETYADTLSSAISTAKNVLSGAQTASEYVAETFTALEEAQASGDATAISEAQTLYDDAVLAAENAAADAQTASAAVLAAATDATNAIDDGDAATATDVRSIVDNSSALADASDALDAQSEDVLSVQVGSGQTMEVTTAGTELLGRGDENLYVILDNLYNALTSGADESEINDYISQLQDAQSRILSLDAQVGAKLSRLDTLSARYEANILNYTEMKSDAEDADLAEVITKYTTAQTVYNAALSAGSEIIQTSLLDFLN